MLKGNLIFWSMNRQNIEKWVCEKLMSSIFSMKKLSNLQTRGLKIWSM